MSPSVTPRSIDAILALVALEFLLVGGLLLRSSATPLIAPWLLYLLSGAFLLVALRSSLMGVRRWIAPALLLSLAAHAGTLLWCALAVSAAPAWRP